jgi:hypothetical protein
MSFVRVVRLSLILANAARIRVASTVLFIAISLFGFMAASALADLASRELVNVDQRINSASGTYVVLVDNSTGLGVAELIDIVGPELESLDAVDVVYVETFSGVPPSCVGVGASIQDLPYVFVYDARGVPIEPDKRASIELPCINGQKVDDAFVAETSGSRLQEWGDVYVVSPAYRELVSEASPNAPQLQVFFYLDTASDQSKTIHERFEAAFDARPQHRGIGILDGRIDATDPGLERAVRGAILIYSIIGAVVLLVGAVASLVIQLLVWKSRSWLVGLARSLGATRLHIAAMVTVEVILEVIAAAFVAIVSAVIAQPTLTEFAQRAFQTDIELAPAASYWRLGGAVLALAVLAGLAPALRAVKADPVDLLKDR